MNKNIIYIIISLLLIIVPFMIILLYMASIIPGNDYIFLLMPLIFIGVLLLFKSIVNI